jgi:hypothetical protein
VSSRNLRTCSGPVWKAADRLAQDDTQAELSPAHRKQAAVDLLEKFAPLQRAEPKELKKFSWYAALLALSE